MEHVYGTGHAPEGGMAGTFGMLVHNPVKPYSIFKILLAPCCYGDGHKPFWRWMFFSSDFDRNWPTRASKGSLWATEYWMWCRCGCDMENQMRLAGFAADWGLGNILRGIADNSAKTYWILDHNISYAGAVTAIILGYCGSIFAQKLRRYYKQSSASGELCSGQGSAEKFVRFAFIYRLWNKNVESTKFVFPMLLWLQQSIWAILHGLWSRFDGNMEHQVHAKGHAPKGASEGRSGIFADTSAKRYPISSSFCLVLLRLWSLVWIINCWVWCIYS